MVVESLLTPFSARKRPGKAMLLGMLFATLGVFLGLWIFEDHVSLVMVFLTVTAGIPLFYQTMIEEEEKDLIYTKERTLLAEHGKTLTFLMMYFIGATVAYVFLYVVMPTELSTKVFEVQTQTITSLNQHVTGNAIQIGLLNKIFMNNVKVMIFCILFAFIYGAGALFILTWNASVIGAAMGNFIKSHIAEYANVFGFQKAGAYFYVASLSLLRYSLHGIPEILAYFVAAMAGGILSASVIKHDVGTKNFERILLDASDLVLLSIFILFIAALIEVFVTPQFF